MFTRFCNGRIYLGNGLFSSDLYIDNEGKVAEIAPGSTVKEYDLAGNTLLPAFRDGHLHPLFAGRESLGVDITGVTSISEIGERILRYRATNPTTVWIDCASYDRSINESKTRAALDEFVPDIPVVLHAEDHHTLWVNTKALEVSGLLQNPVPSFEVGGIDLGADGFPTGILREWDAMNLVLSREPKRSMEDDVRAMVSADRQLLGSGIIEAQDAWIERGMAEVYLAAEKQLSLSYRLAFRADHNTFASDWPYFKTLIPKLNASEKLFAQAVKFFVDGVFGSATAAVLDPYASTGEQGDINWEIDSLVEAITLTHQAGLQTHIHAIGDKAVDFALRAVDLAETGRLRPVIAHAELTNAELLARAKALGVVLCMQPYWAQYNGMLTSCIHHLGSERVDRLYSIRDMLDAGVSVSFGSDWPVSTFNPVEGIAVAVHRITRSDQEIHNPTQAISLTEAIDAYTVKVQEMFTGATSLGLTVGQAFDAVILQGDLMAKDLNALLATEVLAVFRSGKLLPHN